MRQSDAECGLPLRIRAPPLSLRALRFAFGTCESSPLPLALRARVERRALPLGTRRLAPGRAECPQGDSEVSAPEIRPVFEDYPAWLGGMTQGEAGLAVNMVAVA
jgi:hypothetical protein